MPPRKSKTPASPLDAISALLTERTKFEQWLDDLEAKKDSTPSKVYDRVSHDYLGRLQGVMDQLKEHTETLQEHGQALSKKLIELSSVEESRIEERSEAELRAKVGEMTPAEWELVSKRADKELAKLKQDKASIEEELEQVQSVLEDLTAGGGKADSGAKKKNVDELEFLKSVVGTGPRPAAKPPAPRGSGEGAARPSGEAAAKPPTPAAGTPTQTPTSTPAAPAPAAAAPTPTPASTPAAPAAAAPSATEAAKTPPPAGIDKDPGPAKSEQPKTLKCQECGSMNYPSEWYCERCGAELTVV
jgi:hypothetical protein